MAKVMKCSEVGFDCGFVAHGESEEEVMAQVVEHAHTDHGMNEVSPEVAAKVKAAIHDVQAE